MANNLLFYYFGDDEAYYRSLVGEFSRTVRTGCDFKKDFQKEEKKIQSLFLKIYRERPAAIFIDFSKHTQDYLHLARIIARTKLEHNLVTVGLVDYLSPPEVIMESIATGVQLTHIKSAEIFDVVYDVAKLVCPNNIGEHGFARASLNDDIEAGIPAKIGYVHYQGLHLETDFRLDKGHKARLNHYWVKDRMVPSKEFFIQNVSTKNLFYHFKYAVDLEFRFVDEFLPPEGMDAEIIQEKKTEREDLVLYHKKQLSRWLVDNATQSLEKIAKVLVVDRDFNFYNDQLRTDKHPYTVRCIPYLEDPSIEFDRMEAQVVAFALDKEDVLEPKNTLEQLGRLMNMLKHRIQDTSPFVIVFNCKASSQELQQNYQYPQMIASDGELSVEVLLRMAEIYHKKLSKNLPAPKPKEDKLFLRKSNAASLTEILIPIKLVKLSETDLIFQCEHTLPSGTNLHLKFPVDMYVNVVPGNPQAKIPEYIGLIHCLGEEEKKELRRFVNSVFFRDHDAQVHAETEEFKKLNEAKLQEKMEILKRQMAAAEAKKEEENKD